MDYKALYEESQKEIEKLKEEISVEQALVEEQRLARKLDTCSLIEEIDKLNEECDHRAPGDDYDALEISCDILREENECNKKNFLKTLDENKKLKAENERLHRDVECRAKQLETYLSILRSRQEQIEKLREELLQTKFDAWREVQQETNPQYTIDEEIGCLLCESDDTKLIKKIFDELYAGQYEYVIETETYRKCEEESDEEEEEEGGIQWLTFSSKGELVDKRVSHPCKGK